MNEVLVDATAEGTLTELRQLSRQRKIRRLLPFYRAELTRAGKNKAKIAGILAAARSDGISLAEDD
jgi:hypothetical protein